VVLAREAGPKPEVIKSIALFLVPPFYGARLVMFSGARNFIWVEVPAPPEFIRIILSTLYTLGRNKKYPPPAASKWGDLETQSM